MQNETDVNKKKGAENELNQKRLALIALTEDDAMATLLPIQKNMK